jgi:hypothetical protein
MKMLKYSLGMLDQGLLSLASLSFLIVAAQFGSSQDLGSFVLGLSTAVLVQSLSRAVSGEALLVRSTRGDFAEDELASSVGLSLMVAGAIGLLCVALSLFLPEQSAFYLSLGVAQLGLLFQDATRFAALAKGSSGGLVLIDALYAVGTTLAIYLAGASHAGSYGMLTALGVAAGSVGVLAAFAFKVIPRFGPSIGWMRMHWRLNSSFVSEAALGAVLGYSITLILHVFASGPELAAYRAALSIFGLTSLAINFLRTIVLRDLRESSIRARMQFWQRAGLMAVLVVLTVGLTYFALSLLPGSVGASLFGQTWFVMTSLFAATAINRALAGLSVVPTIFLRVQGITWRATSVRIVVTVIGFGLGPVGAWIAGAQGALIAEAVLYLILTAALMVLSRRVASQGRHHHRLLISD